MSKNERTMAEREALSHFASLLVLRGFKIVFRAPLLSHIHHYPRYEEHCSVPEGVASSQPDYAPRGQLLEFAHQGNLNSLLIVISLVRADSVNPKRSVRSRPILADETKGVEECFS
jgi:hypothetical protein